MVSSSLSAADNRPTIQVAQGQLQGVSEEGISAFRGIPYAGPPVGNGRWREPQPALPWQATRSAAAYGNACIQPHGLSQANGGDPGPLSEDCLYLNIWTPNLTPSARLPVMVWIHGGAYIFGSGSLPLYDGSALARQQVVVVTLNFRLGQLGFFAHPALETERPGGPVNFGLLDQIAALRWLHANIAQFGGDPDKITILGQSAGAKSVLALFASLLARGLFLQGVAMSTYGIPDNTRAKALAVGTKVSDAFGLLGPSATAAALRAVPAERFEELKDLGLSNAPVPIVGDAALPQSLESTFAGGREAPVPLILGNTSDDASVVTAFGVDPAVLLQRLRAAGILIKSLYPGIRDERELARQASRDLVFTMPARWIADRHSRLAPTWRYYFDYVAVNDRKRYPNGVGHGAEIAYALDTVDLAGETLPNLTAADRKFARGVSACFAAFAATGNPSAAHTPAWPAHRAGQDRTMLFAHPISVQSNFMRPRLNVLIGTLKVLGLFLQRKS